MLTVGSEFSGVGLLDYGLHLAGLRHAWFCESDLWRRGILAKRFPGARVVHDVRLVGGHFPRVDVIAGGFPCKGASTAGKRTGFDHPETVLWREMARAVGELRPRYVLVENVANILALHDGAVWGEVLGDLAAFGYNVVWDCLPAGAVGAPHLRDRVLAVASHPDSAWLEGHRRAGRVHAQVAGAVADDTGLAAYADESRTDADAAPSGSRQAACERDRPAADPDGAHAERDASLGRVADGRPDVGGGGAAAADTNGDERSQEYAGDDGLDGQWSSLGWRAEQPARLGGHRATAGGGVPGPLPEAGGAAACDRGVAVEWGGYAHAIRRWEAVHGPAPEPLVRRMDDRGAARVDRFRLSALGDGVQVQVGRIAGEYIVELERERLAA